MKTEIEGGMNEILKEQNKPLSNIEIMDLVKGKAKVVLYEDLKDYDDIDELLSPYGAVYLLYQVKSNFGHWCALIKRGDNEIEFFDPLSYFIDEQLKWTAPKDRKKFGMDQPYLTRLLYEAPRKYQIIYNQYPFQKEKDGVQTCGAWSAIRIAYKHQSLEQFKNNFDMKDKTGINDQLVTLWRLTKD